MKDLLLLWKVIAHDMGDACSVDTTLDTKYVESRTESEGIEFLTITLPEFGKAFESWLERGQITASDVPGFRCSRGFPLFLRGFNRQIFSPEGALLDTASTDAIKAVRQLCGVFGKMRLQASPERTRQAMEQYLATDEELESLEFEWTSPEVVAFSRIRTLLFSGVFDSVNHAIAHGTLVPKHGPGSTADGLLGNQKFHSSWTWRLEEFFSSDLFLLPNPRHHLVLDAIPFLDPGDEVPVKVISVPKTAKTPRIIAMEPVCMQYAQQAVASRLSISVEKDNILNRFLRLDEQECNQRLAREGSLTGTLATLDLSEASDRVSNDLVQLLLANWQHLSGAVQACRSWRAEVQLGDNTVTRVLSKFASMGSALTFPIEAYVFLTCVFVGIERDLGRRLRHADLISYAGQVLVYGDDIIVPTDHVGSVIHILESFGFKVNSRKSFWNGKFRESCGKDYYAGIDVSFVKFRKPWPDDRRNVENVVALVSFFNQCKDNGYLNTVEYLRKYLTRLLGGYFPRVSRTSQILGEWDDVEHDISRMCPNTHRPLSKGWVVKDHIPVNPLDGEQALLKFFLKEGIDPLDRNHLHRSGRSRAVSMKLCMAAT